MTPVQWDVSWYSVPKPYRILNMATNWTGTVVTVKPKCHMRWPRTVRVSECRLVPFLSTFELHSRELQSFIYDIERVERIVQHPCNQRVHTQASVIYDDDAVDMKFQRTTKCQSHDDQEVDPVFAKPSNLKIGYDCTMVRVLGMISCERLTQWCFHGNWSWVVC